MKQFHKQFLSALLAIALAIPTIPLNISNTITASAETNWKFDLGGNGTASGYTGVNASTAYSKQLGYGFANTSSVKDVSASGTDALSDAVQFTSTDINNTFNVDLPNGLYQVTVTTGDTTRTSIRAEDMLQLINLTGNHAVETFQIPVTDGQLNIMATEGRAGTYFSISSIEITQLNNTAQTNPTIWLCGDSTVANYYNTSDNSQHGWGQYLKNYLPSAFANYEVRNMAASGQYAKGFVEAGQFDAIETYGKAGDYYIISIGINDTNYSNAEEYYHTVTDMVKRAKSKGMTVMLVKQQGRRSDLSRDKLLSGRWFGGQLDTIGAEQNVTVIDLFTPWQDFGLSLGYDAMEEYYASEDDLHQSKTGSMKLASLMAELAFSETSTGTQIPENEIFMLRNGNSRQYMALDGESQDGTNVVQSAQPNIDSKSALWKAVSAGDGYYYIYSCSGDASKLLDLSYGDTKNGTNIGIWGDTNNDAQLFKFIQQEDGSYIITTKNSNDKSAVEVIGASQDHKANIQEWERNGNACQTWFIDSVQLSNTENFISGDVNHDGIVNIYDLVILKQQIKKQTVSAYTQKVADMNGDAKINSQDVKLLTTYLHGKGNTSYWETGKKVYYAVDSAFNRGVAENTNAGFTTDAYLNLDNTAGSFVEFTVNAPKNGNYLCTFNIANGSANNRQMKIEVNENSDYWLQDFLSTDSWTQWQERAIVLPLVAGENIIRLTSATADGGPNIDYLRTELTDEPIAEIYTPEQKPNLDPVEGSTTVYIAGDSTVQSYRASYAPQQGWGYYLTDYFTDNVTVSNQAIAGRSSKSFYDNGRLQTILDSMQKDDYLLIQFAINDSAKGNEERYAPVCGNVDNPETGSYEYYIEKYIEGTLEKGGTPILVTTVIGLKAYSNGSFVNSYTEYCNACKDMAKKYNIPCIDLNTLMVEHYNTIGYDTAYTYHLCGAVEGSTDMTHFTETGANAVAGLVANAIKNANISISSEVK